MCRFQRRHALLRWVAHAGIGTALELGLEVECPRHAVGISQGDAKAQRAAIDFAATGKLIVQYLAERQFRCSQFHARIGAEFELVPGQVIAFGDLELHLRVVRTGQTGRINKGLFRFQQILLGVGERGEQEKQGEEKTHEELRFRVGRWPSGDNRAGRRQRRRREFPVSGMDGAHGEKIPARDNFRLWS